MGTESHVRFMSEQCPTHVGNETWKRLSKNQKRQIIKNRQKAGRLVNEFVKPKNGGIS